MFGKVAVFSGILEVADTPDKLAAVIGHEASHLTLDHISERVGRGRLSTIAGAVGSTVTGVNSSGVADVIIQLPFQRGQETEADLSGMTYMARAGYNPAAAIELWRSMMKDTEGQRPVEWLSTHPDPEYRMGDIASNLAPALVEYNRALDSGVRPNCHL
jgi:predicted Zn-dependent protease